MFSNLPTDYREFVHWLWPQFEPYYQDLIDRPMNADNLAEWLADWTRIGRTVQETYARLQLTTALNTADAEAEKHYYTFLGEVYPQVEATEQKLKQKLLASGLEPTGFEIPLRNMRTEAALFREANLPLLAEDRKLGSQYDKIVGAQTVQWEGQEIPLPQLRPIYQNPDRAVRERAWRLAAQRWLADRVAINELWTKLFAVRKQIAANADCADYRSYKWRELLRLDYTPDDCTTFQRAIEEVAVPAATRVYERARKRLSVDTLRPWDLDYDLYPVHTQALRPFHDVEELASKIAAIFQHVDPQLGEYYVTMQREQLLDLDNRKGKAPGGFCTEFHVAQQPFIFFNVVGLRSDVLGILHEAGHAFHVFERKHLPYIQQTQVTMEFAEVASMSMELLAAPYLLDKYGGFYSAANAARVFVEQLEEIILFWPFMAIVDAFQHWGYTSPDGGDPARCEAKWAELCWRFMPGVDWSGLDDALVTGWHRKVHLYSAPFYYVEYGLAQLGAVQVWRNALQDQASSLANYRKALSLGSTRSLPELYQAAGAKFAFDAGALREAIGLIESVIEQQLAAQSNIDV